MYFIYFFPPMICLCTAKLLFVRWSRHQLCVCYNLHERTVILKLNGAYQKPVVHSGDVEVRPYLPTDRCTIAPVFWTRHLEKEHLHLFSRWIHDGFYLFNKVTPLKLQRLQREVWWLR